MGSSFLFFFRGAWRKSPETPCGQLEKASRSEWRLLPGEAVVASES